MSLLIHEVANEVKIHIDTIRRAEKRGLISPLRDVNGWRRFSPAIVAKLKQLYRQDDEQQIEAS